MRLPFTPEQFFAVFARYNLAVWPAQGVLLVLALVIVALALRGRPGNGRPVSLLLALLWAWMAVAYHGAFFSAINPAAWVFGAAFLLQALWLVWIGAVRARLDIAPRRDVRGGLAMALVAFALAAYPALAWLAGHRYPAMPTFGLPCPTTIFTIGVLLLARAGAPRSVFIVPLLWSAVGGSAAFTLGVVEDLGLLVAGAIGLFGAASAAPARRS